MAGCGFPAVTACLLAVFVACAGVGPAQAAEPPPVVNNRPVIGILSLPNYAPQFAGRSYFPESYVKWVESGGARVVPIPFTLAADEVEQVFQKLNGVLFTGGGAWFEVHNNQSEPDGTLTQYAATAKVVHQLVIDANEKGRYVPMWATCLGFELTMFLTAGSNESVLYNHFDTLDYPVPLQFTPAAATARMLAGADASILNTLTTEASTFNNHQRGCSPAVFESNPLLSAAFTVVSTNVGRKGLPFVSTLEHKSLPIYGSQWHPEKPQFEWNPSEVIPHTPTAVRANAYFAAFFGTEARRNLAPVAVAPDDLIYNYQAVYTEQVIADFEACYFFP